MIVDLVTMLVEHIKLLLCLCGILNFRLKWSWYAFAAFAVLMLTAAGASLYAPDSAMITVLSYFVTVVCTMAVRGKRRFLFAVSSFFGICLIDDTLFWIIRKIFSLPPDVIDRPYIMSAIDSASIIVIAAIVFILQKYVYKKGRFHEYSPDNVDSICTVLIIAGQVASLMLCAPYTLTEYRHSDKNAMIVGLAVIVYAVMFMVIAVLLIYNNTSKNRYRELDRVNNYLLQTQREYYDLLYNNDRDTRKFRHDISNHFLCVRSLLNEKKYDEAADYITELVGSINNCKPKFQVGNVVANAILNDISGRYSKTNLVLKGHMPEELSISDADVCTIFSNLLENAFCAAAECPDGGNVSLVIKTVAGSMMLVIENDFVGSVRSSKGRLITRKSDKENHGFGMMNVRECLEKHGGDMKYRYKDGRFAVEIVIPFASRG